MIKRLETLFSLILDIMIEHVFFCETITNVGNLLYDNVVQSTHSQSDWRRKIHHVHSLEEAFISDIRYKGGSISVTF